MPQIHRPKTNEKFKMTARRRKDERKVWKTVDTDRDLGICHSQLFMSVQVLALAQGTF